MYSFNAKAQYQIKGKVSYYSGNVITPISNLAISLKNMHLTKNEVIYTDSVGNFFFNNLIKDQYNVFVNALQFKKWNSGFLTIDDASLDLGNIILLKDTSILLNEVEVISKKELITQRFDKLIYNVENDENRLIENLDEVFRKLPLITIRGDENISLNGASVKILLDGKQSTLFKNVPLVALKNIPAGNIKSIEIIASPSAKFDADDNGAIINIITKKRIADGYVGSLKTSVTTTNSQGYNTFLSIKSNKFGFNISNSFNQYNNPVSLNNFVKNVFETASIFKQNGETYNKGNYLFSNASISYEIDSLVSLNLEYLNNKINDDTNDKKIGLNVLNGIFNSEYNLKSSSKYFNKSNSLNIDLQKKFPNDNDKSFVISYQYLKEIESSDAQVNQISDTNDLNFDQLNENLGVINEHIIQTDFSLTGKNGNEFETGFKYQNRNNNSDFKFGDFDKNVNQYLFSPNIFNNRQSIIGLYGVFSFSLKDYEIVSGLRFEQTFLKADDFKSGSYSKNFQNIVPTFYLSKSVTENDRLHFSYAKRISRPSIYFLNPFIDKTNPLNLTQGNPNLNPEKINSFEFGLTHNSDLFYTLALYYKNDANSIVENRINKKEGVTLTTYDNIGSKTIFGFNSYFNEKISKSVSLTGKVNVNRLNYKLNNFSNNGWWYNTDLEVEFVTKNKIRATIAGGYISPLPILKGETQGRWDTYFLLSKDFFKKRILLSIVGRTFVPVRFTNYTLIEDTSFYQLEESNFRQQQFQFNLSYNFGKLKDKAKRISRAIDEEGFKEKPKRDQ